MCINIKVFFSQTQQHYQRVETTSPESTHDNEENHINNENNLDSNVAQTEQVGFICDLHQVTTFLCQFNVCVMHVQIVHVLL